MPGKNALKRSGPADDDYPNKKAATTKLGRPRNVGGDEQFEYMMTGLPDYVTEKQKKANKQPHDIGKVFDDKTIDFIAKFGWDNPFGARAADIKGVIPETHAAVAAQVAEAKAVVGKGPGSTEAEKFAQQARKNEVAIAVRGEISKLYARALRDGEPGAMMPSVDIRKLIESIMARPTQQQHVMVWSKLRARPELENEVDLRHKAASELKGNSSRGAVWNVVASEWFDACSEDEKVITRRETLKILDIELKSWEEQAAADPSSPEEARAFMEASEELVSAMMQFFANRVSGIAVMFLAGPKEVSLSEAVCETPGKPKVLYSQVAKEETTLRLMGSRILSRSRLMNETKWGMSFSKDDDEEQDSDDGERDGLDGQQDGVEAEPMDVHSYPDPVAHQPRRTTSSTDTSAALPSASAAETGEDADTVKTPEVSLARAEEPDTSAECTSEFALMGSDQAAAHVGAHTPPQLVKAAPACAAMDAAEAKSKAAHARARLAKAEAEAADAEAEAAALVEVAAQAAATKAMQDKNGVSTPLQPANPIAQEHAVTPTSVPTLTDAGMSTGYVSVMAFDPCTLLEDLDDVESRYKATFEQASQAISSHKAWWTQTNNPAFFRSVPQKLKVGKSDIAIGCELSLAYFALEQSGAAESTFVLAESHDGRSCLPEYLATFGEPGRKWAARWHKRASNGGNRTPAALDADVNATLPRQWASLQPKARLDLHARISVPAHASMVWPSGLSPGREGVRAFVVTLLNWGSHTKDSSDERAEWRYVAADVAQVLRIHAQKGGRYLSSVPEGRRKLPSAKARDINMTE